MNVIVTSKSALKLQVVKDCLEQVFPGKTWVVNGYSCVCDNPTQPINSGPACAMKRLITLLHDGEINLNGYDLVISIENAVNVDNSTCEDICSVVAHNTRNGKTLTRNSFGILVPRKYYDQAKAKSASGHPDGLDVTLGQCIAEEFPDIPADNWMSSPRFGSYNRKDQIANALVPLLQHVRSTSL